MDSEQPVIRGKTERTKSHIMSVAERLISQKGFENASIRDICAEAGVSVGTFYSHFRSKAELLEDVNRRGDDYIRNVVAARLKGDTPKERIFDFVRYYAHLLTDTGHFLVGQLYNDNDPRDMLKRPVPGLLDELVRQAQEAGEISRAHRHQDVCWSLYVLLRGCAYIWYQSDAYYDLNRQLQTITTIFLHAFSPLNPEVESYDLCPPRYIDSPQDGR